VSLFSDDREHVERVLAGEPDQFEELVRKYNRFGGAIAYGILGDFQLAEDVVQDAFIKAYKSLRGLREPEKFQVWFGGIVKKRAIDVLRQRRSAEFRTVSLDAGLEVSASDSMPVAEEIVRSERRQKVLDAIEDLPEADRLVVVLKHMEGLSYEEIANITGSSVGAVESRLFRARQALKRKFAQILKSES
jgi:RNA polymerase sigma-70 factor (ECF subfamily)